MASRIRVRNDQTGEVGTLEAGDQTGVTFKPSRFLTGVSKAARVVGASTGARPFQTAQQLFQAIPERMLEPALATAGAVGGAFVPVPFASTMLGAGGGALGNLLAQTRATKRTGKPVSEAKVRSAAFRSGIGVATGAGLFRTAQAGGRVLFPGVGAKFANALTSKSIEFLRKAGDRFQVQLEALEARFPDKLVDIAKPFQDLLEAVKSNPGLKSLIQTGERRANTQLLSQAITESEAGKPILQAISLTQAQQFKAIVDRIPGLASKFRRNVRGQYNQSEVELLKFKESVRGAQLNAFGEEGLGVAFQGYRNARQAFDLVEPHLRPGSAGLSGAPNLPADPRVTLAARTVLGRSNVRQIGQAKTVEVIRKPTLIFKGRR